MQMHELHNEMGFFCNIVCVNVHIAAHILVNSHSKNPHSITGGQGNASNSI